MKKAFLMIIASALLATEPLMASDVQANSAPPEFSNNGANTNDLDSTDLDAEDEATSEDMEAMQGYFPRYCPRGYVRRCFCMRVFRPPRSPYQAPMTPAEDSVEQDENGEMDTMQGYYPYRCPRGFVRRCRCVRRPYWPRRPYSEFDSQKAPYSPMEKSEEAPTN